MRIAARTAGSAPRAASPASDMASSTVPLPSYSRRNSSRPRSPPDSSSLRRYAGTGGRYRTTASASDPGRPRVVQLPRGQLAEHGAEHGQDVRIHRLPEAVLRAEVMDDQAG